MKSQALQEFVKQIFCDENTKQQFISNPNSVLSRVSLTRQEKKALLSLHTKVSFTTPKSVQIEAIVGPTDMWT